MVHLVQPFYPDTLVDRSDARQFFVESLWWGAVTSSRIVTGRASVQSNTGGAAEALFGAPIAHEDHARRACYAALHLSDELRRYANDLRPDCSSRPPSNWAMSPISSRDLEEAAA